MTAIDLEKSTEGEVQCRRIAEKLSAMIRSGSLAPETKLQPEKKLAASFSTTVYVIRKVLKHLREEQLVYSRPKFGVFVAGHGVFAQTGESKNDEMPNGLGTPVTNLRFLTSSILPEQRDLQMFAVNEFRKQNPFCRVEIISSQGGDDMVPAEESKADVIEIGIPFFYHRTKSDYLNVGKYFPGCVLETGLDSAAVLGFYSTTMLLYNPDLLRTLGCTEPSWHNFNGQIAYLEEATARIVEQNMPVPGTSFSPLLLLGSILTAMFADFRNPNISKSEFLERNLDKVDRCVSYWRRYQISFPRQSSAREEAFLAGQTPMFFTNSAEILSLRARQTGLDFRACPILDLDGKLPRLTIPLSIRKNTPHPVECIRFLQQYQSAPVQRKAAELGFIPLSEDLYDSLPFAANFSRLEGGESVFFSTEEDYYVGINILNAELWNIILFNKNVEEALSDTWFFARAYLNFQLDRKSQKLQNERGKVFL